MEEIVRARSFSKPLVVLTVLGAIFFVVAVIVLLGQSGVIFETKQEQRFSLLEDGQLSWYRLHNGKVSRTHGPENFDSSSMPVVDVSQTLLSGDQFVLYQNEEGGTTLVRRFADGTETTLLHDDSVRFQITANHEGEVAFVADDSDGTIGNWQVQSIETYTAHTITPEERGSGMVIEFAHDGALLALAIDGLARMDEGGGRFMLIESEAVNFVRGAIAPDGAFVVLPSQSGQGFDVFSVDEKDSRSLSYHGSVPELATGTTFLSPRTFVLHNAGTFTLYLITEKDIVKQQTYSLTHE